MRSLVSPGQGPPSFPVPGRSRSEESSRTGPQPSGDPSRPQRAGRPWPSAAGAPTVDVMTTAATALLITRDDRLLDELLRLAAAAGCILDVAHDPVGGLRAWSAASVVLVGADLARSVAQQRPPRRDHVHLVGQAPLPDEVFRSALGAGALDVVELPTAEAWLVELLTDATDATDGRAAAGRRSLTVGVVGGSGGAGATTFACAVALTAARQQRTVLIDLDPLGPGADRVVGIDAPSGARWDTLMSSRGRLGSRSLRAALPDKDGLAVLTWGTGSPIGLHATAVREVLSAARRGNDVVVVDVPRRLEDVTAEVVTRCDQVLVVTQPSIPGIAAAARVVGILRPLNDQLGLVVRGDRSAVPAGQVATALGLPLVADAPHQRRLSEHVHLGLGPVHSQRSSLARAARAALGAGERTRVDA